MAQVTSGCPRCDDLVDRLENLRLKLEGQAVHLRASSHRLNAAQSEAAAYESAAYHIYVALYGDPYKTN